jgi:hypothetical protein
MYRIGQRVKSNFTGAGTVTSAIIIDPLEADGPKCQKVLFDNNSLGERIWPIMKLDYDGPEIEDADGS